MSALSLFTLASAACTGVSFSATCTKRRLRRARTRQHGALAAAVLPTAAATATLAPNGDAAQDVGQSRLRRLPQRVAASASQREPKPTRTQQTAPRLEPAASGIDDVQPGEPGRAPAPEVGSAINKDVRPFRAP